jgi:hypothetical protein
MCLALLLLSASFANWIPMRWHASKPESLDLLRGTPINCVLLEEQSWTPEFLREAGKGHVIRVQISCLSNFRTLRTLNIAQP